MKEVCWAVKEVARLKEIIFNAGEILHNIPHIESEKIEKEVQKAWNILDD